MTTDTGLIERAEAAAKESDLLAFNLREDDTVPGYLLDRLNNNATLIRALLTELSRAPEAGWVLVPTELTAENGAKAALIGEFYEPHYIHDAAGLEHDDRVHVSWTTIKAIHKRVIALFAASPAPAGAEGWVLVPKDELQRWIEAIAAEADEKGAGGYLLARLTDMKTFLKNGPFSPATPPAEARELVEFDPFPYGSQERVSTLSERATKARQHVEAGGKDRWIADVIGELIAALPSAPEVRG